MEKYSLWKFLEKPEYKTGLEYQRALGARGYKVSDWIIDISSNPEFVVETLEWPIPLVRVTLDSLGFTGPTHLCDFYDRAYHTGLQSPLPEVALALRFQYDEQPKGEWLRIATPLDSMIDSDGIPHLPKLGRALGNYYIETYWSYPQAIFHPHNEFVFMYPQ